MPYDFADLVRDIRRLFNDIDSDDLRLALQRVEDVLTALRTWAGKEGNAAGLIEMVLRLVREAERLFGNAPALRRDHVADQVMAAFPGLNRSLVNMLIEMGVQLTPRKLREWVEVGK